MSITVQAKDHFLLDSFGLLKTSYIKKKPFEPGDRIIFDEHTIFIFEEELGRGNTSAILKVKREGSDASFALRIPQTSQLKATPEIVLKYLNGFINGHRELELMGIRVPKIFQARNSQFALSSIEKIDFSLSSLFNPMSGLDLEVKKKAEKSLMKFIKDSATYQTIDDFHYEQLVYSIEKDEWILIDWDDFHRRATNLSDDYFINGRAAMSEVIAARNQYRELYEHEMPQAMFDQGRSDNEAFFVLIDEVVSEERKDLLLNERQVLEEYLRKLATASNAVDVLKEVPIFKLGLTRTHFLAAFSEKFFNILNSQNFSLEELLEFLEKIDPIDNEQFLILFKDYSNLFKSPEDLMKFLKAFSTLSLNEADREEVQNYLDKNLFNSQFNRTEYPSHLLLDLYNSGFLSNEQKAFIDNALGRNSNVLKNCLRGLKDLFKNS